MSAANVLWLGVAALWLHSGAVQWQAVALHARLTGTQNDVDAAARDWTRPGCWLARILLMVFVITWPAWILVGWINAYIVSGRVNRSRP